jgi:uncharacterized membrane protein YvbJ
MFCSKCGAPNEDSASFCNKCGSPLGQPASAPAQALQSGYSAPSVPASSRKNPLIAAVLNLFIGIGYIYLGYKKVLGTPTILFVVVMLIVEVVLAVFTLGIGSLLLALFLAYDGYLKASGQRGYISTEPASIYQP